MWTSLSLILPVLFPSWRFFRSIEPSPRLQWALEDGPAATWQPLDVRPATVPLGVMIRRLFWNPAWNETLFLVTCAERLRDDMGSDAADHSIRQIRSRLRRALPRDPAQQRMARFRLVFVRREGHELVEQVLYVSDPFPLSTGPRA